MSDGPDPGAGTGNLGVAGVFDVVHRVVADLIAFGEDLAHRRFAPGHLLADLKEGRMHMLGTQDAKEAGGVFAGAVIEGEGDILVPGGAVGVEPGGSPGAADDADWAQAEGKGAGARQAFLTGARHPQAAALPLKHPPAIPARP